MIHVDRERVPIPEILLSDRAAKERERLKELFSVPLASRKQERIQFPFEILKKTKSSLQKLFHGKCAYCESSVSTVAHADVENFRPKLEACGLKGESDPDHYWWLALEWENLYLSCQICNQVYKRSFFPVAGPRATYPGTGDVLRSENALLIDPCNDRPERYLRFLEDGSVESRPDGTEKKRFQGYDRGRVTIDVLGLNREELKAMRFQTLRKTLVFWVTLLHEELEENLRKDTVSMLKEMAGPAGHYSGAVRQILARYIETGRKPHPGSALWEILQPLVEDLEAERVIERREIERQEAPAPPRVSRPKPVSVRGTGYIKEIKIKNFRVLDDFRLALQPEPLATTRRPDPSSPAEVGWKMLLGENAVGKSTVLQAVALALIGERNARRALRNARLTPADLLRRGQSKGSICLTLSSEPGVIEVRFDKSSLEFVQGEAGANTLVRAYGSTRLLPRRGRGGPSTSQRLHDVKNLFDPYARLTDADAWLGDPKQTSEESFIGACLTLKDLLAIEEDIQREKGRLLVDVGNGPVPLERLSSGYQASLALAVDLIRALPNLHDKQLATGIVLVDEIDAHLHPRWKMDIVRRLRKAFPGIQFITTTHEPLCLRGLRSGEVAVLRRNEDSIAVFQDLPSPEGLRVDQLLISPFFGLDSTIDPNLDEILKRYYQLLAIPEKELTEKQKRKLAKLRSRLPRKGVLGYTRRDQLVYEAIDKYLLQEPTITNELKLQRLREETKKRVAEILRGVQEYNDVEPTS